KSPSVFVLRTTRIAVLSRDFPKSLLNQPVERGWRTSGRVVKIKQGGVCKHHHLPLAYPATSQHAVRGRFAAGIATRHQVPCQIDGNSHAIHFSRRYSRWPVDVELKVQPPVRKDWREKDHVLRPAAVTDGEACFARQHGI